MALPRVTEPPLDLRLGQLPQHLHRSDSALNVTTMPGGFENSAMKSSFSLSSLQPGCPESPEHAPLPKERPDNSQIGISHD